MRLPLLIAGLMVLQAPAYAQGERSLSYVDAMYSHTNFRVKDVPGSDQGDGYGVRAWVGRSWSIVTLEYEKADIDGDLGGSAHSGDLRMMRGGVGLRLVERTDLSAWGRAEYLAKLEIGSSTGTLLDNRGAGLHFGVRGTFAPAFNSSFEAGYLKTADAKGPQATVGFSYEPANWGLFTEYRFTQIELDDFAVKARINQIRAGLRWIF